MTPRNWIRRMRINKGEKENGKGRIKIERREEDRKERGRQN